MRARHARHGDCTSWVVTKLVEDTMPEVTVYTAPGNASSEEAKVFLLLKGIPFVEKDASRPQFAQEVKRKAGGRWIAPLILVDGLVIRGFDAEALGRAL